MLVWASQPTYDPNLVEGHFNQIQRDAAGAPCAPAAPLLDRISQGLFIPGSTFKVVTATAALESGKVTPSTTFDDPGYCIEYGKKVLNFADQSGPEVFGTVTFAEALENSINAVFCEVGKRFGARAIIDQAKKFGFYEKPPISSRQTRSRSAASTRTATCTTRKTRTRSTRAALPSGRSASR